MSTTPVDVPDVELSIFNYYVDLVLFSCNVIFDAVVLKGKKQSVNICNIVKR